MRHMTTDEWIEGGAALIFCTSGVYVGMAISEHPILTAPILLVYLAVYAPLAIWLTKRRAARGQRSLI